MKEQYIVLGEISSGQLSWAKAWTSEGRERERLSRKREELCEGAVVESKPGVIQVNEKKL